MMSSDELCECWLAQFDLVYILLLSCPLRTDALRCGLLFRAIDIETKLYRMILCLIVSNVIMKSASFDKTDSPPCYNPAIWFSSWYDEWRIRILMRGRKFMVILNLDIKKNIWTWLLCDAGENRGHSRISLHLRKGGWIVKSCQKIRRQKMLTLKGLNPNLNAEKTLWNFT